MTFLLAFHQACMQCQDEQDCTETLALRQGPHVPHQQVARVAARKVLQRGHRGRERQVLQRVAAQD